MMFPRLIWCILWIVVQDNGGGAPIHFATTYAQLDMVHHLLNNGAEVNQRDQMRGYTALHRAAIVAHYPGGLELYEYLLSRGADPSLLSHDYDPYLQPGSKLPVDEAQDQIKPRLLELEAAYKDTPKARIPHPDIGDFWALYDYGLDHVKTWPSDYEPPYPETIRNLKLDVERKKVKMERKARRLALARGQVIWEVPDSDIAFVFPGQGSQEVGMVTTEKDLPGVQHLAAQAAAVMGYDVLSVCLDGPREKLDDTRYAQPALLFASLVALEKLKAQDPDVFRNCSACAGLSLGEYSALVFAGALSVKDAFTIVKARAEAMAACTGTDEMNTHGMLSVVGVPDETLEKICQEAKEEAGADGRAGSVAAPIVCTVTNRLFPQGRALSGHHKALDIAMTKLNAAGAMKVTKLAVSGAFHTELMDGAKAALTEILSQIEVKEPRIPVISNVTARPFKDADEIKRLITEQVVTPVLWEDSLQHLLDMGKKRFFEVGPRKQIKAMMRRIQDDAWKAMKNVTV